MKAKTLDQQFEDGVPKTATLNLSKAKRLQQVQKHINVDLLSKAVAPLDYLRAEAAQGKRSEFEQFLAAVPE